MEGLNVKEESRVFGRDMGRIFEEIDVIRRKQIELAAEHISMKSTTDKSLTAEATQDEHRGNLDYFDEKQKALTSLMSKLDTLGQIMNDFREASDLNPHNMDRRVSDTPMMATNTVSPTP